jgi:putative transposase
VRAAWEEVRGQLVKTFPKVGPLMDAAKAEVLAFTAFPSPTGSRSGRTTLLERINKEIKRRSRVVGIFPTRTP